MQEENINAETRIKLENTIPRAEALTREIPDTRVAQTRGRPRGRPRTSVMEIVDMEIMDENDLRLELVRLQNLVSEQNIRIEELSAALETEEKRANKVERAFIQAQKKLEESERTYYCDLGHKKIFFSDKRNWRRHMQKLHGQTGYTKCGGAWDKRSPLITKPNPQTAKILNKKTSNNWPLANLKRGGDGRNGDGGFNPIAIEMVDKNGRRKKYNLTEQTEDVGEEKEDVGEDVKEIDSGGKIEIFDPEEILSLPENAPQSLVSDFSQDHNDDFFVSHGSELDLNL